MLTGLVKPVAEVLPDSVPRDWLGALVFSKGLDAGTTLVGLLFVEGLVESNPLVRMVVRRVGVLPGLVVLTAALVLVVVAVTELGVVLGGRVDVRESPVRCIGYGFPSALSVAAASHNGVLIARLCVGRYLGSAALPAVFV